MASLRETIHPAQVFYLVCRQSLNRNPKGGPRDSAFDEFRNGERWQISIWQREVLAGVGRSLTKSFAEPTACRRCYKTHLVPYFLSRAK